MLDGQEIRSFMRSKLRLEILRYLFDKYPSKIYLSEISRNIGSDPSNILGALKGSEGRYTEEDSLVSLGLVKIIQNRKTYYQINDENLHKINEIFRIWNGKNINLELE